jgi:hypothetical protein
MTWSRGLFRAWVIVSALWLALVGALIAMLWAESAARRAGVGLPPLVVAMPGGRGVVRDR